MTNTTKVIINKIDFDLKNLFENVNIREKNMKNEFIFEITASSNFIFEGNNKNAQVRVVILKNVLYNPNYIRWSYFENPLNESSSLIDRVSVIETIANDIYEVITKKRMVKEYFNSLETINNMINESSISRKVESDFDKIIKISSKYIDIDNTEIKNEIILEDNSFMETKPSQRISLKFKNILKLSNKFNMESDIKKISSVNFVSFKDDNQINIDYNPK